MSRPISLQGEVALIIDGEPNVRAVVGRDRGNTAAMVRAHTVLVLGSNQFTFHVQLIDLHELE